MALDFYTTRTLYAVMMDDRLASPTNYWLDTYFPTTFLSTTEEIMFDKLTSSRKIAPFMLPQETGKPIYRRQGETITAFKPAYTKPKDAVMPTEMLKRQPGEVLDANAMTPGARFDREVVNIAQFQRRAIERLWDYMAAQAIINGSVIINYIRDVGGDHPRVVITFGRDAGQTVVLGASARWGDAGISILGTINTWANLMAAAAFGGFPNRMTVGATAWAAMQADAGLLAAMSNTTRSTPDVNINRGIVQTDPMRQATFVGTVGAGIDVYLYNNNGFQADDGTTVSIMDPRDIVLTAPGVEGIRAFGAILDPKAGLAPMDIFPKMFDSDDPPGRFIMSQSAPLMIPVNPNRTMRVRVVA